MNGTFRTSIRLVAALAASVALAGQAKADFAFPATGVAATDSTGPSFTLTGGPYSSTSLLTLTATGIVNLNVGPTGPFTTNAAGVIMAAGSGYPGTSPGTTRPNSQNGIPYGALLVGNASLGFFQVFPSTAANGLGSTPPTSTVAVSATIASIFGAGTTLANGTVLFFKVNDNTSPNLYGDNSGTFTFSGALTAAAVPEPASVVMLGLGSVGFIGLGLRRRRQVA